MSQHSRTDLCGGRRETAVPTAMVFFEVSETVFDVRGQTIETRQQAFDSNGNATWYISRTTDDSKGRAVYSTDQHPEGTAAAEIFGSYNQYDAEDRSVRSERRKGVDIAINGTGDFLIAELASAGQLLSFSTTQYDNAGRVTESFRTTGDINTNDPDQTSGLTTEYTYNRFGETTQVRRESWNGAGDGKVVMVSRTYFDDKGRATLCTDSYLENGTNPTFATETLYDSQGRGYSTVRYEGTDIAIDADGMSSIAARGTVLTSTTTFYDTRGRVEATIGADGGRTDFEYDDQGRRVATIGPEVVISGVSVRHRTETIYDDRGRVASERAGIIQNGISPGVHYDPNDLDSFQETSFTYDENGNVARTTWDDGSFALVRYDVLGRKIAESQQVVSTLTLAWSEADHSYVNANDTAVQIPTRWFQYDSQGRLAAVELPAVPDPRDNNVLKRPRYEYGYDAQGQQTSIRDAYDSVTQFQFDPVRGFQIERELPFAAGPDKIHGNNIGDVEFSETFQIDDRGRQELQVSFEGVHMVPVYDPITGRMTATHYFEDAGSYNSGMGSPDEIRSYTYDDYGRQIVVDHSVIETSTTRSETTTYDARGRTESVTGPEGTILYGYDDLNRQTRVSTRGIGFQPVNPDDFENVTDYTYDELGRLKTVTATERNDAVVDISTDSGIQPDTTTYDYDLIGNLDATRYSNQLVHDYQYDDLNRLEELTHFIDANGNGVYDSGEQKRAVFDYVLRADGKRESVKEEFFTNNDDVADITNDFTWDYDDVGRLVAESLDSTDSSLDYIDSFVFDLVGNRTETTRDGQYTISYDYDANDRLTTETKDYVDGAVDDESITYDYDQTQQTSKETTVAGVTTTQTFTYNLQGRMSLVSTDTNGTTESTAYAYDSAGNRIRSTHVANDGTVTVTEYLTDTRNPTGYSQVAVETTTTDGQPSKRIVYTIGHDQISQTVYASDGAGGWNAGETHHFGTDGHGSVRVLYGAAAAIVQDIVNSVPQIYHFDAYGNLLNFTDGVVPLTSYLYSGEAFDQTIGQQYLRARWYDPASGRFNRLDPFAGNMQDPQSLHKYTYVHGDPIQMADPTGLFGGLAGAVAGAAIRGALVGGVGGAAYGASYGFARGYLDGVRGTALLNATAANAWHSAKWGAGIGALLGGGITLTAHTLFGYGALGASASWATAQALWTVPAASIGLAVSLRQYRDGLKSNDPVDMVFGAIGIVTFASGGIHAKNRSLGTTMRSNSSPSAQQIYAQADTLVLASEGANSVGPIAVVGKTFLHNNLYPERLSNLQGSLRLIGDQSNLPQIQSGQLNQVIGSRVQLPINNPTALQQAFAEWYRVLKPGGEIRLSVARGREGDIVGAMEAAGFAEAGEMSNFTPPSSQWYSAKKPN